MQNNGQVICWNASEAFLTNSADPVQTAPIARTWSTLSGLIPAFTLINKQNRQHLQMNCLLLLKGDKPKT